MAEQNTDSHWKIKYMIKPIEITKWVKGHCPFCNLDCDKEAYMHHECAIVYERRNREIISELIKKKEKKHE